jgi:arylsulfatase A-like enzyme
LPTLAKKSADYIAAHAKAERPFFLYVALASPHTPIVPAPQWAGKSGLGPYGDFVMQTDDAVGRIVDAVRQGRPRR